MYCYSIERNVVFQFRFFTDIYEGYMNSILNISLVCLLFISLPDTVAGKHICHSGIYLFLLATFYS